MTFKGCAGYIKESSCGQAVTLNIEPSTYNVIQLSCQKTHIAKPAGSNAQLPDALRYDKNGAVQL